MQEYIVIIGRIIHSISLKLTQYIHHGLILVNSKTGNIIKFLKQVTKNDEEQIINELKMKPGLNFQVIWLKEKEFIIPGFVDTHVHAPQYAFAGTGYDLKLLEWLNKYTFPTEAKFQQIDFAEKVYPKLIKKLLSQGTTTVAYFGTIHTQSTQFLAKACLKLGQRALVGKVCMNRQSPSYYIESTEQSLSSTELFCQSIKNLTTGFDKQLNMNKMIQPIITPRFLVSCTRQLLSGLAKISTKYQVPIQTHLNQQKEQIEFAKFLEPTMKNQTSLYEETGILGEHQKNKKYRTLLAHCVHMQKQQIDLLQKYDCGVSHCPNSNLLIRLGISHIRQFLNRNIRVGLGTDIAGGSHPSILDAIRLAMGVSKALSLQPGKQQFWLNHNEVFYMATLGGAHALSLQQNIGNFQENKKFDAQIISLEETTGNIIDIFEQIADSMSTESLFQKFIYLGDDRNVRRVFVNGKTVLNR